MVGDCTQGKNNTVCITRLSLYCLLLMTDSKQHISDLVHHCLFHGMRNLVISPGSRNAPLTRAFAASSVNCISVVDERSAAFVALGMAHQLGEPVGVLCTSGSAPLNYGPAIAEAYYLRVPLMVISADRPAHLVDQQDSQTIRQNNLFDNIVKASFTLPEEPESEEELQQSADILREAFKTALYPDFGPVHINVPLDEPLYANRLLEQTIIDPVAVECPALEVSEGALDRVLKAWNDSSKKMIVCGQHLPCKELNSLIARFKDDESVVIVAENLSNLKDEKFIERADQILLQKNDSEKAAMAPDCIISFGGHLVTKHLKLLLRAYPAKAHFRIDPENKAIDTYKNLTEELVCQPTGFFRAFVERITINKERGYRSLWDDFEEKIPADGEYHALRALFNELPAGAIAHLGNSMAVRHVQKLISRGDIVYHSNRGVAGIDGCLSTAAGTASVTDELVLCCLGDLSFIYDSNGLWNNKLPANLRVVVLNNQGGDIFKRLKGPSESPGFEEFFIANHPVDLQKLVEAYGVTYLHSTAETIATELENFYKKSDTAKVLEVKI